MNTKYSIPPEYSKTMNTSELRNAFHIPNLFTKGSINITYTYDDRIIIIGIMPADKTLVLEGGKEIGSEYFLERRELGIINIGGPGLVIADGEKYTLGTEDGLYLGTGIKEVTFASTDASRPAMFYCNSAPAHHKYPSVKIDIKNARPVEMGDEKSSNKRTIFQYLHPNVLETCQLSMGLTKLAPGNIWNTMPVHTHERRMEVYFYFNIPDDNMVFHFMGQPDETRHIIMRNYEAVISPSWSIHSGAGTSSYTFIWGMAGENKTFTDMDHVDMKTLK